MLRDSRDIETSAMRLFIERFREDAGFHDLVRNDIHAALAQVGISVPRGVKVDFAYNAATALSMTLDHSTNFGEEAVQLEDSQLEAVAGGVNGLVSFEEIASFLRVFKHIQA